LFGPFASLWTSIVHLVTRRRALPDQQYRTQHNSGSNNRPHRERFVTNHPCQGERDHRIHERIGSNCRRRRDLEQPGVGAEAEHRAGNNEEEE
jgi:hypothetical protein